MASGDTSKSGSCDVTLSWKPNDGQHIEDVIIYRQETEDDEIKTAKSCDGQSLGIYLSPAIIEPETQPCSMSISTISRSCIPPVQSYITAMDLLCSARRMEVFTDKSGYVCSVEGVRVDEELGLDDKLYMLQHSFAEPVTSCNIKILRLIEDNKLWIHSLYISLEHETEGITTMELPTSLGMPSGGKIDLGKVKAMLSDMGGNISERGQGLLNTMEIFQKNKAASIPGAEVASGFGPMAAMMTMFAGMKTAPASGGSSSKPSSSSASSSNTAAAAAETSSRNPPKSPSDVHTDQPLPDRKSSLEHYNSVDSSPQITPDAGTLNNIPDASGPTPANMAPILLHLEHRLQSGLMEAEQRLRSEFSSRLEAAETRIHDRLDRVLDLLTRTQGPLVIEQNQEVNDIPQTGDG